MIHSSRGKMKTVRLLILSPLIFVTPLHSQELVESDRQLLDEQRAKEYQEDYDRCVQLAKLPTMELTGGLTCDELVSKSQRTDLPTFIGVEATTESPRSQSTTEQVESK